LHIRSNRPHGYRRNHQVALAPAPLDTTAYIDILILLIDASRRAGITMPRLFRAALVKLHNHRVFGAAEAPSNATTADN